MEMSDFYQRVKILNKNKKNLHHSSSMNSISIDKNYSLKSNTEHKYIKNNNKNYPSLSKSFLGLVKRPKNKNHTNEIKIPSNNFDYKNNNFLVPKYNHYLHLNTFKKNYLNINTIENKQNIYPNIYLHKTRSVFKKNGNNTNIINYKNQSKIKLHRSKSQEGSTIEMATFYSTNKNHNSDFILDKKIKILNETKFNTYSLKYMKDNDKIMNLKETKKHNNKYKGTYNRLIPSELNLFKDKLLNESETKEHKNSKSQEYIPFIKDKKNLSNLKNNFTDKNKNKLDEKKNYENIDFKGTLIKIITKLPNKNNININNHDNDYHKIMKHPFVNESFGYNFLRNAKKGYKIYENPFDDKNLIYYIHNLIINPNTKKFRNDNLIIGSDYYKRKDKSSKEKDYKLLSKQGYIRLQNSIMKNLKKDAEKSLLHMKKIKDDMDILMENNLKKFQEHREGLINDEI